MTWESNLDDFNNYLAITFVGVAVLFPVFILVFLQCNYAKTQDEEFKDKYKTIYENTRADSRLALMNSFNQMFRRLLFAVTAVFLMNYTTIQLQALIFQCLLLLLFIPMINPFTERSQNYQEVFNEGCILCCALHLLTFTDF